MKKLLVLMLVLATASLASAVTYSASSPEPFVILITFTDPTPSLTLDAYVDWSPIRSAMDVNAATLTKLGNTAIGNLYVYTAADPNFGVDWYYLAMATMTAWTNGTDVAKLDLNGAGANVGSTKVTLQLYDDVAAKCGTVDVFIPEPATIALLCLGGLLLRKKK
jgi:hypothetical protein